MNISSLTWRRGELERHWIYLAERCPHLATQCTVAVIAPLVTRNRQGNEALCYCTKLGERFTLRIPNPERRAKIQIVILLSRYSLWTLKSSLHSPISRRPCNHQRNAMVFPALSSLPGMGDRLVSSRPVTKAHMWPICLPELCSTGSEFTVRLGFESWVLVFLPFSLFLPSVLLPLRLLQPCALKHRMRRNVCWPPELTWTGEIYWSTGGRGGIVFFFFFFVCFQLNRTRRS